MKRGHYVQRYGVMNLILLMSDCLYLICIQKYSGRTEGFAEGYSLLIVKGSSACSNYLNV